MNLNFKEIETPQVVLVGDNHGEYSALFKKIDSLEISDSALISVGDNAWGFPAYNEKYLIRINEEFKKRDIECFMVRGNHCRPDMYLGQHVYSNLKLVPDYTVLEINGEIWQFVGGAISVDRKFRVEGRDYWRDEVFVLDESKAVKCDALVTHSAPPWLGPPTKSPFVEAFSSRDVHLISELTEERKKIKTLYDICQPKKSYAGHFHDSYNTKYENQTYSCDGNVLDILEFKEHRQ